MSDRFFKKIKAISFDDSGTLRKPNRPTVQSEIIERAHKNLVKTKIQIPKKNVFMYQYWKENVQFRINRLSTKRETSISEIIYRTLTKLNVPEEKIDKDILDAAILKSVNKINVKMYDDSVSSLKRIKKLGIKIAIVTNNHWPWNNTLKKIYSPLADVIIKSTDIGFIKPHKKIFTAALEKLKLKPKDIIHIGDDIKADIKGATKLGIATGYILRKDLGKPQDLPVETYIFSDLKELLRKLGLKK